MRITTSTLSHPRGPVQSAAPKHNTPANVARRRPTNNATIGHAPSDTSPSGCQSKRAYPIGHQSQTDVKGGNNRMRGETLTDRQQEVLDKIREHIERTGLPPSRSELAGSLGLAHASAVKHHLHALEKKGWLEVKPGVVPRDLPTVRGDAGVRPRSAADGPRGHAGARRRERSGRPGPRRRITADPPSSGLLRRRARR